MKAILEVVNSWYLTRLSLENNQDIQGITTNHFGWLWESSSQTPDKPIIIRKKQQSTPTAYIWHIPPTAPEPMYKKPAPKGGTTMGFRKCVLQNTAWLIHTVHRQKDVYLSLAVFFVHHIFWNGAIVATRRKHWKETLKNSTTTS